MSVPVGVFFTLSLALVTHIIENILPISKQSSGHYKMWVEKMCDMSLSMRNEGNI